MNLKLNNKRTILVGLAFLSICAFWQMYNSVIPKILTYTFHLDETYSGIIMAADNVLALFLLPLFGAISDKSRSRMGRRMPFILCGTGCAVLLMMLLPILDNSYAAAPPSPSWCCSSPCWDCCWLPWAPTALRRSPSCPMSPPSRCAAAPMPSST